jgi:hypothetical protein
MLTEMRWQPGDPTREDLTLQLWIEAIREDRETATMQDKNLTANYA